MVLAPAVEGVNSTLSTDCSRPEDKDTIVTELVDEVKESLPNSRSNLDVSLVLPSSLTIIE